MEPLQWSPYTPFTSIYTSFVPNWQKQSVPWKRSVRSSVQVGNLLQCCQSFQSTSKSSIWNQGHTKHFGAASRNLWPDWWIMCNLGCNMGIISSRGKNVYSRQWGRSWASVYWPSGLLSSTKEKHRSHWGYLASVICVLPDFCCRLKWSFHAMVH